MRWVWVCIVVACGPLAGCRGGSRAGTDARDVAAIRRAHEAMQAASARADWEGWTAMHADNAVMMIPNRPPLVGREAIGAYFRDWPAFGGEGVELLEIETRGDLGYVRGRYRITMTIPGAGVVADSGKTLEIWRKDAHGRWRLSRDMSSSDVPAVP